MATESPTNVLPAPASKSKAAVVKDIISIIEKEYNSGNSSVTEEKYQAFLRLQGAHAKSAPPIESAVQKPPAVYARPQYPALFYKFRLPKQPVPQRRRSLQPQAKKWTFKRIETTAIGVLETAANILDNIHILSRLPMFPKKLGHLLKHTNRLWVLILVFLVRKTLSQLLNVRRKQAKVERELGVLRNNRHSRLLEKDSTDGIFRKYEKVLKDLAFDKLMLRLELLGNVLDLSFNMIELYSFPVPDWFMSMLNMASMAMTVYRMNKDDEYVDDDIAGDLI